MGNVGYVTSAQVQEQAVDHYRKFNERINFKSCVKHLLLCGDYATECPFLTADEEWSQISDEEFYQLLDSLPIRTELPEDPASFDFIMAEYIMPKELEVFAIKYVRDIVERKHAHNFFEVNYVFSGSCRMVFENETRMLQEGQLCVIAPDSLHDVTLNDDSVAISLMLRQSTFETTFFRLLAQEDLLADFFRRILYSAKSSANYLLFTTDNSSQVKNSIKNIFMECYVSDVYSNTCVVSRIHLLFSLLLRKYGQTIQCYEPQRAMNTQVGFTQILQYIQEHYQTITLESLAERFHYNPSYVSRLVKANTGHTLTELLTVRKLSQASDLLLYSKMRIQEIASAVGYDSVDHFSRQFKKKFRVSPDRYRKEIRAEEDNAIK